MAGAQGKDSGARRLAWEVLWRTHRDGAYPDRLLGARLKGKVYLSKTDRALASELIFGTLRWQKSLDRALRKVCHHPIERMHPKLLILLRLGAYQLLYLDRIPPSAAVNESVQMAKGLGLAHAPALVNGVLRQIQRKGKRLLTVDPEMPVADRLAEETSHPRWMVQRWIAQWGDQEARDLCRANNHIPPLILRTNTLKISRQRLASSLQEEGVLTERTAFSPDGLRVIRLPGSLESLNSFQRGEFSIQDEASQLMVYWLDLSPGLSILDACAAPGGKSTHIGQRLHNKGRVCSVDIHEGRLRLVKRECQRLGIDCVQTAGGDLTDPVAIPCGPYDRILLDAPCTGLGVLRRHPDAKWRRVPEDMARMADLQMALLKAVAQKLCPGGILLYGVCTHTPEETTDVLEAFLDRARGFHLLTSAQGLPQAAHQLVGRDGIFRTFPHRHQMDGFTAFRLQSV